MLERVFQLLLIRRIKIDLPGSVVLKNDPNYIQGFPDLTILFATRWGVLEVKPHLDAPFQPNQEYYLEKLGRMSYAGVICPENEEEVLRELYESLTAPRETRLPERK